MTVKTRFNTEPDLSHYNDIDLLRAIAAAGEQYQKAQQAIHIENGPHEDNLWLGPIPVMYIDECIGYFVSEGDWVNFHEAALKKEA